VIVVIVDESWALFYQPETKRANVYVTGKHTVLETGSVSVFKRREGDKNSVGLSD
jgi:hypothetical protein